jgi:hypothetical protein
MGSHRPYIDCREFPSEMNCSLRLAADGENELLEAAVQHAVALPAGSYFSLAGGGEARHELTRRSRLRLFRPPGGAVRRRDAQVTLHKPRACFYWPFRRK